jgi:hypothetical protein
MACPGSVRLAAGQASPSSAAAIEGTHAHTLAETCLRSGAEPLDQVGRVLEDHEGTFEVTDEMAEYVTVYTDYVRSLCPGGIVSPQNVEIHVSLDHLLPPDMRSTGDRPMLGGTSDFIGYDAATDMLHVVDLKYGKGHIVEVKGNPQALTYGVGARQLYPNVENIRITIVQPRAEHADGVIRHADYDWLELVAFEHRLRRAAIETSNPAARIETGEHCTFCPAIAFCEKRRQTIEDMAQDAFGELIQPAALSAEKLGDILRTAGEIKDWLKGVQSYAQMRAQQGEVPSGFKIVEKLGHRKWADAEAAEAALRQLTNDVDAMFAKPKFKTVAQMEKAFGKKLVEKIADEHIRRNRSASLVPADDPRPAVSLGPEHEFGDLT